MDEVIDVESSNPSGEVIGGALEIVGTDSLAAITRGEIDIQIATAKRYPRSLTKFKQTAIAMATLDEDTAESCIYSRPVGKKFNQATQRAEEVYAEGLSVRLAEIACASYSNIRYGSFITEMNERKTVGRGFCFDLENNVAAQSEVAESTVTREGKPYSERQRILISKVVLSKAARDAVFKVIPKALLRPIEKAVRELLVGDGSQATISKRRSRVIFWIKSLGIDITRVYAALGIDGEDDIGIPELDKLTGIKTALLDKEITVDEAFPFIPSGPQKADPSAFNVPKKEVPRRGRPPKTNGEQDMKVPDEKPKAKYITIYCKSDPEVKALGDMVSAGFYETRTNIWISDFTEESKQFAEELGKLIGDPAYSWIDRIEGLND